ncbi:MAG: lipid-A-disaccharide synthase N-terminal domain-containing protein [Hyphomicrobiales bacterium]
MLVDLAGALGGYLQDVFVEKFNLVVLIGLIGQGLFTMRFLVQWLASERAGRSVIPFSFWLFSIGGGLLLFAYSLWRRDLVFILGQGLGVFIYLRNVVFVLKERREEAAKAR